MRRAGKLYPPAIQSSASLHNRRGSNRRWMKVQWQVRSALNLEFSQNITAKLANECFGNVGILQRLALGTLDELNIKSSPNQPAVVSDENQMQNAAMIYAEQLDALYQQFAKRVSKGIRTRENSTGIYAHAIAVILEASDETLMKGLALDAVYEAAHARQSRIQKGNLRAVLEKFEDLQIDEEGRGLVLSYNDATSETTVVDRQLLLYRKYATVKWPWEEMIREADKTGKGFGEDA